MTLTSEIIPKPLSHNVYNSFYTGKYLDQLKISKSVPIYENSGLRQEVANYRNV